MSVSVFGRPRRGMMPSLEAVQMIAEEFGVPFPPDKVWNEEFDPGEFAVNLVSLYAPPRGRARMMDLGFVEDQSCPDWQGNIFRPGPRGGRGPEHRVHQVRLAV